MRKVNYVVKKYAIGLLVVVVLLFCGEIPNAATKTLSLIMKDKTKSISASCTTALCQGGALAGGAGVKYNIKCYHDGSWRVLVKDKKLNPGNPGQSFEHAVQSMNGYAESIKLTMHQADLNSRGIGWGKMTYEMELR